ncbi:uncharacterized protein UV8b_01313 [Ustilaginoidea virens]|uniref:MARVEL domain-containing protein n=1 Tax=Ustilaginoidea virens TaxID=1159556 RepID=A0A8E5MEV8_USTVR|nr:uncharacterized protein UV8b_01313 [Ustilaginoidea virens]QUC17072.1 hypothetical protein UV8b_01313 [Ustilaginoidea virens]
MGQLSHIALRVLQGALAGANLGLSAYIVNYHGVNNLQSPPEAVGFLLFASILSILSILYLELAPRFLNRIAHPYASLAVQGLNTICYFAGFIAFAVFRGYLAFCQGDECSASRGDAVIAAAAFCAWIASTIMTAKQMIVGGVEARRKAVQMREVQLSRGD